MRRPRSFRDLPLFWKFLLPPLALLVGVGAVGTFVVVRNLSERAQVTVDEELAGRLLEARTALHDRELYLLESVNFASNLRGMDAAIEAEDAKSVTSLLRSVLALKRSVGLLAVTDRTGRGLVEFVFPSAKSPRATAGRDWISEPFVASAVSGRNGDRTSGFVQADGRTLLAIAGPVCTASPACRAVGVAIAGIDVRMLAAEAHVRLDGQSDRGAPPSGFSLFAGDGRLLAAEGASALTPAPAPGTSRLIRGDTETVFAPFDVQGRRAGTIAVTVSRKVAFSAVHGTGTRLALIVLATMVGLVALMALLSRRILVQVRPLVATNRAIGEGDLTARVPVKSRDELGELALGVNRMAERLQASYETLETRVAERTEEVRRLLQQRSEFFTSMSHEFRTPLAVILSEAQMLEDSKEPKTRRAGTSLRLSSEQLLGAINEILQLAESDAGTIDIQLEKVKLSDIMRELRPTVDRLAADAGLDIRVRVPGRLSPVAADPNRLKEIILNLVDNAAKYTATGGAVEIAARSNNGTVEISVADTGIGIPEEIGARVFEPFFRVPGSKPVRGQASSGLGLALAKRLVEAQGGSISFRARPDGGTVFDVSLRAAATKGDDKA